MLPQQARATPSNRTHADRHETPGPGIQARLWAPDANVSTGLHFVYETASRISASRRFHTNAWELNRMETFWKIAQRGWTRLLKAQERPRLLSFGVCGRHHPATRLQGTERPPTCFFAATSRHLPQPQKFECLSASTSTHWWWSELPSAISLSSGLPACPQIGAQGVQEAGHEDNDNCAPRPACAALCA